MKLKKSTNRGGPKFKYTWVGLGLEKGVITLLNTHDSDGVSQVLLLFFFLFFFSLKNLVSFLVRDFLKNTIHKFFKECDLY